LHLVSRLAEFEPCLKGYDADTVPAVMWEDMAKEINEFNTDIELVGLRNKFMASGNLICGRNLYVVEVTNFRSI
jgi:hypothetical protein